MKKRLFLCLVLLPGLLLCACRGAVTDGTGTTAPASEAPTTTAATVTVPETTQAATVTTAPSHSALYLPDYTTEQILEYFEEVVLHMEYTDGTGNPSLVQKWLAPIRYRIYGSYTDEDLAVLTNLFEQLNEIAGFPGIYAAAEFGPEDLSLNFLDPEAFRASFSDVVSGEDAYGAVQFWYYTDTNEIHTARVGYRTDIDQATRTSILIEEIINALGITDTVLRPDSIVYQYSNDNLALSDVDWVIMKLLYNPAIQCGMDADSCRSIIQDLYE